jgi:hypothetical protein
LAVLLLTIPLLAMPGQVAADEPPAITNPQPDPAIAINIPEGSKRTFSIDMTDDSNELDFRYTWSIDGTSCYTGSKNFTFQPDYEMAGEHQVTIEVRDGYGGKEEFTWLVQVLDKNRGPTLDIGSPLNNTYNMPDEKVYFDLVAKDADGDTIEMWVFDNGKEMKKRHAVGENGTLVNRFKKSFSIGSHDIEIRISDGNITKSYYLVIGIYEPHRPPIPWAGWAMTLNCVLVVLIFIRHRFRGPGNPFL